VPASWPLEIANGLVMAERRGRINPAESASFVAMIEELPIVADEATGPRAMHETMSLAREHRLTAYDAAYLELAMRLGLPLATDDRGLRVAAGRTGVTLLGTAPQRDRPPGPPAV
jgi:predicted nucleic acid-binding protein